MGLLSWIAMGGGFLLAVVAVILALNWTKVSRLMQTISLFAPDQIVYNFSNMKDIMPATRLPASGTVHQWPMALTPINENWDWLGQTFPVAETLRDMQTTALVVVKDGRIVFESYYLETSPQDLRISWSLSKSFVSALTGIALANGDISSLDVPVSDYVPALKRSAYNGVPLRHVMNMASGVQFDEDYLAFNSDINKMGRVLALGGSLDDFSASVTHIARTPGCARQYVSIDTHVIAMVLRAATGKSLQDYFVENLWSKMGASADAYYSTDTDGNAFALGGLNMRTRDYALFGELMRNQGRRGDVQLIPADWVTLSTINSAPADVGADPFGYGYQWWVPNNADEEFFGVGVYGQYIYVNPKAGIVIAKNAADLGFNELDVNGDDSKSQNIALFRSIAAHYSDWQSPQRSSSATSPACS